MEQGAKAYDVVVVGAGRTGSLLALQLADAGCRVGLVDVHLPMSRSFPFDQMSFSSFADSLERIRVAHGWNAALEMTAIPTIAQNFLLRGFKNSDLIQSAPSPSEILTLASYALAKHETGFAEFTKSAKNFGTFESTKNAFLFQNKLPALYVETRFFESLRDAILLGQIYNLVYIKGRAVDVQENKNGCEVKIQKGSLELTEEASNQKAKKPTHETVQVLDCEIVALTCGPGVATLARAPKETLIVMDDYVHHWRVKCLYNHLEGKVLRSNNGHVSAFSLPCNAGSEFELFARGPGFVAPKGEGLENILKRFVFDDWQTAFSHFGTEQNQGHEYWQITDLKQMQEVWPCDELPIVGEIGKLGKIVTSVGWFHCGLLGSLYGAKVLSDLILRGTSADFLPLFHPKRLLSS